MRIILPVLIAGCLTGCSEGTAETSAAISGQKEIIEQIEARVAALEGSQPDYDTDLKLGDGGYSIVPSSFGNLTAQMTNVDSQGSGSRVSLRIGNPSGATLSNVKIYASWGKLDEKGSPIRPAISESEFRLSKDIPAGTWTNHTVVIDGIKPADLGYLHISTLSSDSIKLASEM
jgi:hypothetical protein